MKLGIFLVLLGSVFLVEGGVRLVVLLLSGEPWWAVLSALVLAAPCFWFGIRRIVAHGYRSEGRSGEKDSP